MKHIYQDTGSDIMLLMLECLEVRLLVHALKSAVFMSDVYIQYVESHQPKAMMLSIQNTQTYTLRLSLVEFVLIILAKFDRADVFFVPHGSLMSTISK